MRLGYVFHLEHLLRYHFDMTIFWSHRTNRASLQMRRQSSDSPLSDCQESKLLLHSLLQESVLQDLWRSFTLLWLLNWLTPWKNNFRSVPVDDCFPYSEYIFITCTAAESRTLAKYSRFLQNQRHILRRAISNFYGVNSTGESNSFRTTTVVTILRCHLFFSIKRQWGLNFCMNSNRTFC